ncbi:unnamed protein product [Lampetra planeri]
MEVSVVPCCPLSQMLLRFERRATIDLTLPRVRTITTTAAFKIISALLGGGLEQETLPDGTMADALSLVMEEQPTESTRPPKEDAHTAETERCVQDLDGSSTQQWADID